MPNYLPDRFRKSRWIFWCPCIPGQYICEHGGTEVSSLVKIVDGAALQGSRHIHILGFVAIRGDGDSCSECRCSKKSLLGRLNHFVLSANFCWRLVLRCCYRGQRSVLSKQKNSVRFGEAWIF